MCFHTTHILYQCGCLLPLPAGGPGYIPPKYCSFVKWQWDMYHTQPDRLPEPVPLPAPRTCSIYWGTEGFIGNVRVLVQSSDCPTHAGLPGLNAVEIERERQDREMQQRGRQDREGRYRNVNNKKKRKTVGKKGQVYRWKSIEGIDHESIYDGEDGPFRGVERVEVSAVDSYGPESLESYTTHITQGPTSSRHAQQHYGNQYIPKNHTIRGPRGLYYNSNPFRWPEYKLLEARRRGVQIALSYPERRMPMPEGTVMPGMQLPPGPAMAVDSTHGANALPDAMATSGMQFPLQYPIVSTEATLSHLTELLDASPKPVEEMPSFVSELHAAPILAAFQEIVPCGGELEAAMSPPSEVTMQANEIFAVESPILDLEEAFVESDETLSEPLPRRASTGDMIGYWR